MVDAGSDTRALLALDIGEARIGMALASPIARIPHPAGALDRTDHSIEDILALCRREGVGRIVLGLPRGMQGQETRQTQAAQAFGEEVMRRSGLPCTWQDEAVTSVQAEAELKQRKKPYTKADIDALAATYILEDYLRASV
jgi:putative Holliday junction resolvase